VSNNNKKRRYIMLLVFKGKKEKEEKICLYDNNHKLAFFFSGESCASEYIAENYSDKLRSIKSLPDEEIIKNLKDEYDFVVSEILDQVKLGFIISRSESILY
jgi:hypothetical protein